MTSTIDLHDIYVLDANGCVLNSETQTLTINAFDSKGGCQSVSFFLPTDQQTTDVVRAVIAAVKTALPAAAAAE